MDSINCAKSMLIQADMNSDCYQINSNCDDQENDLDDDDAIESSSMAAVPIEHPSSEPNLLDEEDNSDYFARLNGLDDSDNDSEYFYNDNNGDIYIHNHLNRRQLYVADCYEEEIYQRSKRSNKKIRPKRQIKTKHSKSIQTKSRNKQLYTGCRLDKIDLLDLPIQYYKRFYSSSSLSSDTDLEFIYYDQTSQIPFHRNASYCNNRFRDYTINESNISNESHFDDHMITMLLDIQNRDLSPNDYEMLLRLDEGIQRKTVDKTILDTLPTINVNDTHLNDLCTICMETYTIGQQIKLLPCTHIFHLLCIETYLKEFSIQCPLDNLPLI